MRPPPGRACARGKSRREGDHGYSANCGRGGVRHARDHGAMVRRAGRQGRRARIRQDGRDHPGADSGQQAARRSPARYRCGPHRAHGRDRHRRAGSLAHLAGRPGVRRPAGDATGGPIQRHARGRREGLSDTICRSGRDRAAGACGSGARDRASRRQAGPQRHHHQLPHDGRVSRRAQVPADLRGGAGAGHADLPSSARARAVDGDALPRLRALLRRAGASPRRQVCTRCA